MKIRNIVLIILFLLIVACSPDLADKSANTSGELQLAEATGQDQTAPDQSTSALVSTSTTTPSTTFFIDDIVERPYDPGEWKLLYDKYTVQKIEMEPTERLWILPGGKVGYLDIDQWVFLSLNKCQIQNCSGNVGIAPDNTVWFQGYHELFRYQNGNWDTFPLPKGDETARTGMTIDASGAVWVVMSSRADYDMFFEKFDGKNWSYVPLWKSEWSTADPPTFLFTPDGVLWVANYYAGEVGRYDGKTWKIYTETDLWAPQYRVRDIQITSDPIGNIYGVSTGPYGQALWITKINTEGQVSRIPFPTTLTFNPDILKLFVDSQDTIWVNACLDERFDDTCLAYYKDDQWVSFTDLPINSMMLDMKELSDGTYLIATLQGVYEFNPEW